MHCLHLVFFQTFTLPSVLRKANPLTAGFPEIVHFLFEAKATRLLHRRCDAAS